MTAAVNLLLGVAYIAIGTTVALDLRRRRPAFGTSLSVALIAMAFTCGPHHLDHGLHLLTGLSRPSAIELVTLVVGLPPAVFFAVLTVGLLRGTGQDRRLPGTPGWLVFAALFGVGYLASLAAYVIEQWPQLSYQDPAIVPNLLLVPIYAAVGTVILRTQAEVRSSSGSWSWTGLSLGAIFPTCAAMHATWALLAAGGQYAADTHLLLVAWASVPAGIYFLWVVRRLGSRRSSPTSEWYPGRGGPGTRVPRRSDSPVGRTGRPAGR